MLRRCLVAGALLLAVPSVALAHDPRSDRPSRWIGTAANLPLVTSPNVRLIATVPGHAAISGVFSRPAPYFYVSGLDSVSVFDVRNPRNPARRQARQPGVRERGDELGERAVRRHDPALRAGRQRPLQASAGPGGIQRGRPGGGQIIIVDVTDPAEPASRTHAGAGPARPRGTHTVACMNSSCTYAYTAGRHGPAFSIVDLSDLDEAAPGQDGLSPAGGGEPGLHDRRRPLLERRRRGHRLAHRRRRHRGVRHPRPAQSEGAQRHRRQRHARRPTTTSSTTTRSARTRSRSGQRAPSVANGNVAAGHRGGLRERRRRGRSAARPARSRPGSCPTSTARATAPATPRRARPGHDPPARHDQRAGRGRRRTRRRSAASARRTGSTTTRPGSSRQGYYQQGLRLIDVRNPRELKQFGFFTGGASEVWDAYWVPQRDAARRAPGTQDEHRLHGRRGRGVDVFEVDVPGTDLGETDDSLLDLLP